MLGAGGRVVFPMSRICRSSSLIFQRMNVPIGNRLMILSISWGVRSLFQTKISLKLGILMYPSSIAVKSVDYFSLWVSGCCMVQTCYQAALSQRLRQSDSGKKNPPAQW